MKSIFVVALLTTSPVGDADRSWSTVQFHRCGSGCVQQCVRRVPRAAPRDAGKCVNWKCVCPQLNPRFRQPHVKAPVVPMKRASPRRF